MNEARYLNALELHVHTSGFWVGIQNLRQWCGRLLTDLNLPNERSSEKLSRRRTFLQGAEERFNLSGLRISLSLYVALSIVVGLFVFLIGSAVGPVFASLFSLGITYELIVSHPRELALRRQKNIAKDLPKLSETIGQALRQGDAFETALSDACNRLRGGVLQRELQAALQQLQRGTYLRDILAHLSHRLYGPEARLFLTLCTLWIKGALRTPEPFFQFADSAHRYRVSTEEAYRRVKIVRQLSALSVSGMSAVAIAVQLHFPDIQSSPISLTREIGAIVIVASLFAMMRLTARSYWEVHDG